MRALAASRSEPVRLFLSPPLDCLDPRRLERLPPPLPLRFLVFGALAVPGCAFQLFLLSLLKNDPVPPPLLPQCARRYFARLGPLTGGLFGPGGLFGR